MYFENKYSPVEIHNDGIPFIEFQSGNLWSDSNDDADSYSNLYLRTASKRRIYSLDPYKILDLLGDMGGLLDIINAFGVLFTASIVKEAFNRSLLSDAYQVQGYTEDESEYYISKRARECFRQIHKSTTRKILDDDAKSDKVDIELTESD